MWRPLTEAEISQLIQQKNSADDWTRISVACAFSVLNIRNCHFHGEVKIEDNVMLSNVLHIENYRIGTNARLSNIGKLSFTEERFAYPLELCNEDGRFTVIVAPGMNTTDVCSALRIGRPNLYADNSPETMGYIGENVTIENVTTIHNTHIESNAILSGCCEIKHAYIDSTVEEPARIGSAVILRNAIVHRGSHLDSRAFLSDVLVGQQVSIAEGARVYQSAIGDNSHIAGCEIGHSFLYPCHEQHHSNSFLIAAHIQGQSNMAAGATLGSNHNGRKNDVDLFAGRGFWPGLCSSIAFPSQFAPYTLIAKGSYPRPLRIPFAFSLINNNVQENCLEIMPAFWWMHNAYALMRNEWKYEHRDKRVEYTQHYDYKPLAPDTIHVVKDNHQLLTRYLAGETKLPKMEMSNRSVRILKADEAVAAYREMMLCYMLNEGVFNNKLETLVEILDKTDIQWVNVGGNVLTTTQWQEICNGISLTEAHKLQTEFTEENKSLTCFKDAVNFLPYLCEGEVTASSFRSLRVEAIAAQVHFYERVIEERKKDLTSEFRNTNPLFPFKAKEAMEDNICKEAAVRIAELERFLHI
ncbi:MAG: DUF4954 family protein [Bacteroidales bacterium]|nr:DUF4954 family protein [Bacteroidales bacterium]